MQTGELINRQMSGKRLHNLLIKQVKHGLLTTDVSIFLNEHHVAGDFTNKWS